MFTTRFGVPTIAATILMLLLSRGISEGALINYLVEFEATDFHGVLGTAPPINVVSGSFSFTWDDQTIPPQIFPADSVNLSIGDANYNVTNTAMYAAMNPLVLSFSLIGSVNGTTVVSGTDDFSFIITPITNYGYSVRSSDDIYLTRTVSQQITVMTPIPEPGSIVLFALGGGTWLACRARRRGSKLASQ